MNKPLSLIPQPASLNHTGGTLRISGEIPLVASPNSPHITALTDILRAELRQYGISLRPTPDAATSSPALSLTLADDSQFRIEGSYQLITNSLGVHVKAGTQSGLFYGIQTILQLIGTSDHSAEITIPCVEITDTPRFTWRGMHLDVSRHFVPADSIKKYIDLLARHKMNVFHWHLTDDQGWRIEIKAYPRLTEIGAWRTLPDGATYGGFYTQQEIREIVEFARQRAVTIVPEIEMPGHASAALAAYPEFSCTGGPFKVETTWGVFDDVYCAGNDATFAFLETILSETAALFPGQFFHIGGDECPKTRWHSHDLCQQRMKIAGLKDEDELQAYFVARIGRYLASLGKRLVGWDEILDGGAPAEAAIMAWRGIDKGITAARAGHDVIMTPMSHCYFDHYQGVVNEPHAIGGFTPLSTVYRFEPIPADLSDDLTRRVLGAQGNVWTEYMPNFQHIEYMAFPRLCALAEILWSPSRNRTFPDFLDRLRPHLKRLDRLGVNYRRLD